MSSASASRSGSTTLRCDSAELRKTLFDLLDSPDSSDTMSTKPLGKECEQKLKIEVNSRSVSSE
jgi:hypothetical protein